MNKLATRCMAIILAFTAFTLLGGVTPVSSYNCELLWCTFSSDTFRINMLNQGAGGAINGFAESNKGVSGTSNTGNGIYGYSAQSTGIIGWGGWDGVEGVSQNPAASGVYARNTAGGRGLTGYTESTDAAVAAIWAGNKGTGLGVHGFSTAGTGVVGQGKVYGVKGESAENTGVRGQGRYYGVHGYVSSTFPGSSAVLGENQGVGYGVYGFSLSDKPYAGVFGQNYGAGYGVRGRSAQGPAGFFEISNNANPSIALKTQTAGAGWAGAFYGTGLASKGVYIKTNGGAALQVVGGTKSAVVGTSRGSRALYAEEASEVYFTDYGFGKLKNGAAVIPIDPIYAETVNLNQPYHVFVQTYGDADLVVSRRTPRAFEVRLRAKDATGDPDAEFSYRLVAKRRGFEQARLEPAPWADQESGLSPEPPDQVAANR